MKTFLLRPVNQLMTLLVLACFALSIFRVEYSGTRHFLFLIWNLFLAGIPYVLVQFSFFEKSTNKWVFTAMTGLWLLFFPNAPYILTDLFHLSYNSSMPIWFDLVLILLYAWTGLLAGFFSLSRIEQKFNSLFRWKYTGVFSLALVFLSSFGIYLGRYLRFNSWDLFQRPSSLMGQVADRFIHPMDHPRTWGFTVFMGMMLSLFYFSLKWILHALSKTAKYKEL